MKKIIDGKRYDTETAKEIGSDEFPGGRTDFHYWCETLYQKKTGEFFIHGEGHGLSRYAERYFDGWGWGEKIIPISYDEARGWVEHHLDADTYEEVFGPVAEDDSRKTVGFSLPVSIADTLKRMAAETGRTQSDIVAELIEQAAK